ncbi:MFS transporter [Kribbella sp. CA-294648]|uniref:MFS transporter n=1 Tax=Kribbella sp. CA-294648 TaxID=3239948 RepID=UPI003D8F0EA6
MLIPVILAAALMNAAMVAASAVSTILVAEDLSPSLGGLPNTAGVLGTAAGAVAVGRWTARVGRAQALRAGYGVAVAGGALTVLAAVGAPVALLFVGMFLLGAGNAASLLSRYAAADAVDPRRRAAAMSTVVWASTAGAVGGPFLLQPAQSVATSLGLPPLAGPFLLAVAATFAALLAASRIRPPQQPQYEVRRPGTQYGESPSRCSEPDGEKAVEVRVRWDATVAVAAGVMLIGHLVMVAMMTSVPVHAHHHGQGLGALGLMLSVHTLGMFAFAPITGWWIDRAGPRPVVIAGLVTVIVSALAVAGPSGSTFTLALFALGYGWNLCYLGGSAMLAGGSRLESRVEAGVWAVSAIATAASTWLFSAGGFLLLAVVSVVLGLPLLVVVAWRRRPAAPSGPVPVEALAAPEQACG